MPMTAEYFQHDVDAAEARGYARGLAEMLETFEAWRTTMRDGQFPHSEGIRFLRMVDALAHAETPED